MIKDWRLLLCLADACPLLRHLVQQFTNDTNRSITHLLGAVCTLCIVGQIDMIIAEASIAQAGHGCCQVTVWASDALGSFIKKGQVFQGSKVSNGLNTWTALIL